jgi:hypothetical protein
MPTTTRGYPYPSSGDPANVPSDLQALATALDGDVAGLTPLIQAKKKTSNTTSASTTEVFVDSITWTAVTGESLMLMMDGTFQGSIVGDIVEIRFRYLAGASVTSAGTQFGIKRVRVEVANSPTPVSMHRVATGIAAGQTTVGISINRQSGTGTVQINGAATDEFAMTWLRVLHP